MAVNNVTKDVLGFNPQTYEYKIVYLAKQKGGFAEMIRLRILSWEDYPGEPNHKGSHMREAEARERTADDDSAIGFEDGDRGPWGKECRQP